MASVTSKRSEVSTAGTCRTYRFSKEHTSDAGSTRSHKFQYDVYIFYDLEDHDFVVEYIIRHLDSDFSGNYKCCYEIKDFSPGYYYAECIGNAMRQSYWTFLVFSKTSVKNGFTNFLYHQTLYTSGGRRFLPIRIEECEIPTELENVTIDLDFTLMPPEQFQKRLLEVISRATCFLRDDRLPTLGRRPPPPDPRRPPALPPRAPRHIPNDYTLDSLDDLSENDQPAQHNGSSDKEFLETRMVDTKTALLRRKTNSFKRGEPQESPYDLCSSDLLARKESYEEKWSIEAFHDNPEQYIDNFNRANSSSPNFRKFEHTLLGDILPEVNDRGDVETVNATCLVRLTCCPSLVVKRRAFCLLENRLVRDDLRSADTASGLMETEELLRHSLLGKPFQTETSNFQSNRLKTYGRLLFYVAMHIEKRHLTFDLAMVRKVSTVDDLVNELLKQVRKLSLPMVYALMVVSHGHKYLLELVQNMETGLSADNISERINALSNVLNFQRFTPWFHLKTALRNEHHWIYLDVMLSYVGNLALHDRRYIHVLLRHLPLLLEPYPSVAVNVRCGVLLNMARMLVSLITRHDRNDIRMSAMFGLNSPRDCPGLTSLWQTDLYRAREYKKGLQDIVLPLMLTAADLKIREVIYKVFFESAYLYPYSAATSDCTNIHLFMDEENKMMDLIRAHLTSIYERIGDRLDFRPHTLRRSNNHIMEAYFNHTTVVAVKVPRMWGRVHMVDPKTQSPACRMLQNEVDVLGSLSHEHVVQLISCATPDVVPMHAVMEYLNGGNLQCYLQQAREACVPLRLSRLQLLEKCVHVGEALGYLAERGVVHRDICAYNVLLQQAPSTSECVVKLSGFSLACRVSCHAREETAAGTSLDDKVLLRWSDPESLHKGIWSIQTDTWMFWCLVFEVFTYGTHPFPECLAAVDVPNMVGRGYSLQQPLCVPNDLNLLIQQGLQPNIKKRKTITRFLESLRTLRQDWHYSNRREERTSQCFPYPDHPRDGMERMTPNEFQEKQSLSAGRQRTHSGTYAGQASVQFKILPCPDVVDASDVDQPRDNVEYLAVIGNIRKLVRVNCETLKAHPEKLHVIRCLRQLDTKHVCRILDLNISPNKAEATLLTEMDVGGNILEALLHHPSSYTMEHVVSYMVQVLEGLQVLHTRHHVVHTDLRAQYIYAGGVIRGRPQSYFRVKIGRLARCKMLFKNSLDREGRTKDSQPIPIDSLRWAPAEVIYAPAYYSRASDIYSLGLVFWQLIYALQAEDQLDVDSRLLVPHPEWPLDREEFHRNLMLARHPDQPARCPDWAYVLIKMCLRDRYKRPNIDLLQEALTAREPFKSTLLEGVRQQLENSCHKPDINFGEQQAEYAPYLEQYRDPLSDTPDPSCLSPQFEESDNYFLVNARFGFEARTEDDATLLIHTGSAPTALESVNASSMGCPIDGSTVNVETDTLDYKSEYIHRLLQSGDVYSLPAAAGVSAGSEEEMYETIDNNLLLESVKVSSLSGQSRISVGPDDDTYEVLPDDQSDSEQMYQNAPEGVTRHTAQYLTGRELVVVGSASRWRRNQQKGRARGDHGYVNVLGGPPVQQVPPGAPPVTAVSRKVADPHLYDDVYEWRV